ncbi:hypothetical protein QE152_g1358 [Popillia japonica]|uniref:Retrovirus-related Pol polyprotein from transposon TNT 1-94 n=1 Tax=Popillia japonica TaxID=7064 RepID=A0AAW1N7B4_POPJA
MHPEENLSRNKDLHVVTPIVEESTSINNATEERLRPRNTLKQPQRFQEYETGYFSVDIDEPTSNEETMSSNHATEWQAAMNEELKNLDDNDTWKLVDKPEVCNIVDNK